MQRIIINKSNQRTHTWDVFLDLAYVEIHDAGARWTQRSWTVYLQTKKIRLILFDLINSALFFY